MVKRFDFGPKNWAQVCNIHYPANARIMSGTQALTGNHHCVTFLSARYRLTIHILEEYLLDIHIHNRLGHNSIIVVWI